jgi:hypothetical protein
MQDQENQEVSNQPKRRQAASACGAKASGAAVGSEPPKSS